MLAWKSSLAGFSDRLDQSRCNPFTGPSVSNVDHLPAHLLMSLLASTLQHYCLAPSIIHRPIRPCPSALPSAGPSVTCAHHASAHPSALYNHPLAHPSPLLTVHRPIELPGPPVSIGQPTTGPSICIADHTSANPSTRATIHRPIRLLCSPCLGPPISFGQPCTGQPVYTATIHWPIRLLYSPSTGPFVSFAHHSSAHPSALDNHAPAHPSP